jgi:hypothetical protein
MEDRKRREELKDERYREWQERRREPGDALTWVVVLGGLMAVLLFLSAAYDGSTGLGAAIAILILAWVMVVWVIGGVNVVSVLWGRTVGSRVIQGREPVVLGASGLLALVSISLPLADVVSSFAFGIYGLVCGLVGLITLVFIVRAFRYRAP